MKATALIMAGGRGERFWPRSRQALPKQFLSLTDDGKTMIQLTVERISALVDLEDVYIASWYWLSCPDFRNRIFCVSRSDATRLPASASVPCTSAGSMKMPL